MRVITGIAGGRKLKSPEGEAVRPTADHVKQAMFNILQFDLEGRRILDLFGGTGQLGIDALSYLARGEKFDVIFIDPPYDGGLYQAILERINAVDNLTEGGIIVCEARAGTELPELSAPYCKLRERRYGNVKICIYSKNEQNYE